ncbi:uncharacterized protein LOC110724244 isoform X2 [Chenopodium quinoa]|nr:uncharacterized protein LOC110724244 isoform X2 [Chenopodium quinoa]
MYLLMRAFFEILKSKVASVKVEPVVITGAGDAFVGVFPTSLQDSVFRLPTLPSRLRVSSHLNRQQQIISHSRIWTSGKMCSDKVFTGCRMDRVGSKRRAASPLVPEYINLDRVKLARIGPSWVFVTSCNGYQV